MIKLLPYQQRWVDDESIVKYAVHCRRIGFTFAAAYEAHRNAVEKNRSTRYISFSRENNVAFLDQCRRISQQEGFNAQTDLILYDDDIIQGRVLKYPSGEQIIATTNANALQKCDVIIDNAAFLPNLAETIKIAKQCFWAGKVSILSSLDPDNLTYDRIIADAESRGQSVHCVTLDDAVNDGLYQKICELTGKPWCKSEQDEWREKTINLYGKNAFIELFCRKKEAAIDD